MNATTSTEADLLARCHLVSACATGLTVIIEGKSETRAWSSINSAGATIVEHGGTDIFVLALSFNDLRTFVVGELEPAWTPIIEQLHIHLPGVEPFASWAPRLIETPGVVNLFGA